MRPKILNSEINPTKPAPTAAALAVSNSSTLMSANPILGWPINAPPKVSCSIGAAAPMMPIPAETFIHNTIHNNQNCGVLCAFFKCTCRDAIMVLVEATDGVQLAGFQPTGGTR